MLIVTLSAALMLLSIVPQADAAKSHLKCGGDNLQCGNLAKVCNPKNGKCCCLSYGTYHRGLLPPAGKPFLLGTI
jgi:hypothetical protein